MGLVVTNALSQLSGFKVRLNFLDSDPAQFPRFKIRLKLPGFRFDLASS